MFLEGLDMEKFIIIWNAGYGDNAETIEAENQDIANDIAYENWREDAENQADYRAVPYNKETALDYDLIEEDEVD